ncbi:MAG: AraC family transcriptional regulator [Peptococcaceae bacterium]|nr:AraC family transcriptional regulator [Peptococcaceae bacterium]
MLTNFNRDCELMDRLETNFLRILCYDFEQYYTDTYKSYEYARLCTILEGEKKVTIKQDSFTYDQKEFLLLPPYSEVHMKIDTPTKALVFELDDDLIKKTSENVSREYDVDYLALIEDQLLCAQGSAELQNVLYRIIKVLNSPSKRKEYLIDIYAQELVYHLFRVKGVYQLLTGGPDIPINKALQIMHSKYMYPLTINEVASELNMSEANFSHYFKKIMGINPKEYLTNLRMVKAKELIVHSSVTDVAYDLGYNNISLFINHFRKKYGLTPKQYQKKIQTGNDNSFQRKPTSRTFIFK